MDEYLRIIGRKHPLFVADIISLMERLDRVVSNSAFLVIGGAGSIGSAVVKEIFKRNPLRLHVIDISENNLTELVRDIRSEFGYIDGDFRTFAIDVGSKEYDSYFEINNSFDYVLNLSALKHVRSEKDVFTLMRMIDVNIFNTIKTIKQCKEKNIKNYFCVSTDKAANPVNLMGASKRIMEMFAFNESLNSQIKISMARFANVAFSDGSLLHSFKERIAKKQPIAAPKDVKRYFLTPQESGELCLLSCIFGENGDIFFPKLDKDIHLLDFLSILRNFLAQKGIKVYECLSEDEARSKVKSLNLDNYWPCYLSISDTTGEKDYEEFFTDNEDLVMNIFESIGVIKTKINFDQKKLNIFYKNIINLKQSKNPSKKKIIDEFFKLLPKLDYEDKEKYLDAKM